MILVGKISQSLGIISQASHVRELEALEVLLRSTEN